MSGHGGPRRVTGSPGSGPLSQGRTATQPGPGARWVRTSREPFPDGGLRISAGGAFKHDPLGYEERVEVGEGATENPTDLSSSSFVFSRFLKQFERQVTASARSEARAVKE